MAGNGDNRALQEDLRDNVVELNKNITSLLARKRARTCRSDSRLRVEDMGRSSSAPFSAQAEATPAQGISTGTRSRGGL
ncbi:hypothetical protein PG984_015328 [Apiospora sp. TS-2023a]